MPKIELIKLDQFEICSEMALCMAHCMGASYDTAEDVANTLDPEDVVECIVFVREWLEKKYGSREGDSN